MEQKDILNSRAATASHPKALYILFFTEMWERFAYYLMVGILLLYLIDPTGKGFGQSLGADVVGSFIALVYLTPFIGGVSRRPLPGIYKIDFPGYVNKLLQNCKQRHQY